MVVNDESVAILGESCKSNIVDGYLICLTRDINSDSSNQKVRSGSQNKKYETFP